MTTGNPSAIQDDVLFTKRLGRAELLQRGALLGAGIGLAPLLRAGDALGASAADDSLTVWYLSGSPQEIKLVKGQFASYGKRRGVKVSFSPYSYDASNKALSLALPAGKGPDLAYASPGPTWATKWAKSGFLTDLTAIGRKRGWNKHMAASVLAFHNPGGKIFGYPIDLSAVGNFYNPRIFGEQGIKQLPTTFAQYEAILAKLKAAGITPFAVGGKDQWPLWHIADQLIHGTTPFPYLTRLYYLDKSASWNIPSVIRAFRTLQSWVEKGYFNDGFLGSSAADANDLFINQKVAMELGGSWNNAQFIDEAKFTVRFFRTPAINPRLPYHMGGFQPNNLFIVPKAAKQPELAFDFIDFVLGAPFATALWRSGDIPAYVFKKPPKPQAPLQLDVYNAMRRSLTGYYSDGSSGEMAQAMYSAIQALAARKLSPEQAAAQIQSVYKASAR